MTDAPVQPMSSPIRSMVIHTAVAFVAAHLVVVLLHEVSHVVAGLVLGFDNELYPFGVTHSPDAGRADAARMALTGPVFSLATGLLAMVVQPFRRSAGFAHLFWTWLALMSVMEGSGYLLLTPFGVGDTGSTAEAFDTRPLVVWLSFAVAVATTFVLAQRLAVLAVRHTPGDLGSLRAFTFFPWMIGTAVAVALTGVDLAVSSGDFSSGDIVAVIAGSVALGVFAPMAMPFASRLAARSPSETEPMSLVGVPVLGVGLVVVITLLNVLVLARGLSLG